MQKNNENQMTQEQYNSKVKEVAQKAIHYVQTDNGWFSMRDSFNELCEGAGANKVINHEATIGRRKLLAQSVCIQCISELKREAVDWLQDQLNDIAEDYEDPRQARGFRR